MATRLSYFCFVVTQLYQKRGVIVYLIIKSYVTLEI